MAATSLYAGGVGLRRYVASFQTAGRSRPLPFTLESALQFRTVRTLFSGQGLPEVDRELQYPTGVRTAEYDTLGAEFVYAWLCRWFPGHLTLTERLRWVTVGWFCLGIPLLVVWVHRWTGSPWAGWVGGALYAVSLSSVLRSTGQELSHENFALPWLVAHMAAQVPYGDPRRWSIARWMVSTLALTVALMTWDLSQWVLGVLGLITWLGWCRTPFGWNDARAGLVGSWVVAVALTLVVSPYARAHHLLVSPMVAPVWALGVGMWMRSQFADRLPMIGTRLVSLLVLAGVPVLGAALWGQSYGHFASLIWAKLKFLNQKPADPSRLTFEQRILWTPALHSMSWRDVGVFFPGMTLMAVMGTLLILVARARARLAPLGLGWVLCLHWLSVGLFLLMARFCVFAAISGAVTSALTFAWLAAWGPSGRRVARVLVGVAVALEAGVTIAGAPRWGEVPVLYDQLEDMAEWLRQHVSPRAVVANFQTSPFILTYGRCPIVLNPKFESAEMRRRVQEFAYHLFRGTERSLRDWMVTLQAQVLVYSMGEFTSQHVDWTLRYAADALVPPPDAPARAMEGDVRTLSYFRLLWQNAKYRVFEAVTPQEEAKADQAMQRAREALEAGQLDEAESWALTAWRIHPNRPDARQLFNQLTRLRLATPVGEERPRKETP